MMKITTALVAAVVSALPATAPAAGSARAPLPRAPRRAAPIGATPLPPIGLSLEPRAGVSKEALGAEILSARSMGLRLVCLRHSWEDLEPAPGIYELEAIEEEVKVFSALGFEIALTIGTIDGGRRTLPWDLAKSAFDAETVRDRFDLLLGGVAAKLPPAVRWVLLGHEVDDYLGDHPKELETFAGLVERGRSALRRHHPGVLVGVVSRNEGLRDRPRIAARLGREMDVAALTYQPLGPGFAVRPLPEIRRDFARMAKAAAGKPIFLAEVGCPADRLFGGEERQAASIEAIFDEIARRGGEIAGVNFERHHDIPEGTVDAILAAWGVRHPRLRAYLATLGLKKADGTPRKAWERFRARLQGE